MAVFIFIKKSLPFFACLSAFLPRRIFFPWEKGLRIDLKTSLGFPIEIKNFSPPRPEGHEERSVISLEFNLDKSEV
jgi:hypothetical protein